MKTLFLIVAFPLYLNAPHVHTEAVKTPRKTHSLVHRIDDMEAMVRCVSSESGTCYTDAYRVAQVIVNRSKMFGLTVGEVVYQKGQFSGIGTSLWNTRDQTHLDTLEQICLSTVHGDIPDSLLLDSNVIFFINPAIAKGRFAKNLQRQKPAAISTNNHHFYESF